MRLEMSVGAGLPTAHGAVRCCGGSRSKPARVGALVAPAHDDVILALLAIAMRDRGELANDTVVSTVMANIGFHRAMAAAGIAVRTTAVGDRYVLEDMNAGGYSLGGEQSGHLILAEHATTGDGLLTALHLMAMVAETGRPLAELASVVERFPQVLINVRVPDRAAVAASSDVQAAVAQAQAELGDSGRVLLRPSGTEPLVRVMVEAATDEAAQAVADRVAKVVAGV